MSGVFKFIKKVFKKVVKVAKVVVPILLAAAAIYFTAGMALGVAGMAGGWGAAAGTLSGALGAGTGILGSVVTGAITGAGYGALVGAAGSALSGGNILKGLQRGALSGAVVGGAMGGFSYLTAPPPTGASNSLSSVARQGAPDITPPPTITGDTGTQVLPGGGGGPDVFSGGGPPPGFTTPGLLTTPPSVNISPGAPSSSVISPTTTAPAPVAQTGMNGRVLVEAPVFDAATPEANSVLSNINGVLDTPLGTIGTNIATNLGTGLLAGAGDYEAAADINAAADAEAQRVRTANYADTSALATPRPLPERLERVFNPVTGRVEWQQVVSA